MYEAIAKTVGSDPRVDYALVFGSVARGTSRPESDIDVAVAVSEPLPRGAILDLISKLESATGKTVDLVLVHEAPPALAFRIFKEGEVVFDRDHQSFVRHKTRAILDYLDFKPIEDILTRGAITAAKNA